MTIAVVLSACDTSAGAAQTPAGVPCASTTASIAIPNAGTMEVQCKWQQFLPGQVYQSSPNVAVLDDGGPSILVGSRDSGQVFALHLADGSSVAGWPVQTVGAVDSSPTVIPDPGGSGHDDVAVAAGDVTQGPPPAFEAGSGALTEFGPSGNVLWSQGLADQYGTYGTAPALYASPAAADTTGSGRPSLVEAGVSLTQYEVDAATGATDPGWPRKTADSTFSTAAVADLQGGTTPMIVAGSDSSAGPGALYDWNGGVVRAEDGYGGVKWVYRSDEVVTSSPAIGNLDGSGDKVVFGHGRYWSDREPSADATTVTALDSSGRLDWQTDLHGYTPASPALADLKGDGSLDVVEPTWTASGQSSGGAVYALDPHGAVIWGPVYQTPLPMQVSPPANLLYGGVATADFGQGYQDVVYGSGFGWNVLDGRTGQSILPPPQASEDNLDGEWVNWDGDLANLAMQNTPLITADPSGSGIDVVLAGTYAPSNPSGDRGFVAVYWVHSPSHAVTGVGAWPMFHHDPQHTGASAPAPLSCPGCAAPGPRRGYWLAGADGGVLAYGGAPFYGSMGGGTLSKPVVGMAATPDHGGYWLVASDGGIFAFGDAAYYGSMGAVPLSKPVVGMAATPDGAGYWEVAADGGVFAFGDAKYYGSTGASPGTAAVVGIASSADGLGYWTVAADGGVFSFGDASFHGSMGGQRLDSPITAIAPNPGASGYWLAGADGGIFAFDAPFRGSMGGSRLAAPVASMASPPPQDGTGYWEVAADGGVFALGAPYDGSAGGLALGGPIVAIVPAG
ncbi:MAG: hypothetical protein ACYDB3_04415 [Acidimicrobiales bacterium]